MLDQSPASAALRATYLSIADAVHTEVQALSATGTAEPVFGYDEASRTVSVQTPAGARHVVSAADLRRACRCARCVDELTGTPLLRPEQVRDDVRPTLMQRRGNYAVAINWSDGHTSSIYPYTQVRQVEAQLAAAREL